MQDAIHLISPQAWPQQGKNQSNAASSTDFIRIPEAITTPTENGVVTSEFSAALALHSEEPTSHLYENVNSALSRSAAKPLAPSNLDIQIYTHDNNFVQKTPAAQPNYTLDKYSETITQNAAGISAEAFALGSAIPIHPPLPEPSLDAGSAFVTPLPQEIEHQENLIGETEQSGNTHHQPKTKMKTDFLSELQPETTKTPAIEIEETVERRSDLSESRLAGDDVIVSANQHLEQAPMRNLKFVDQLPLTLARTETPITKFGDNTELLTANVVSRMSLSSGRSSGLIDSASNFGKVSKGQQNHEEAKPEFSTLSNPASGKKITPSFRVAVPLPSQHKTAETEIESGKGTQNFPSLSSTSPQTELTTSHPETATAITKTEDISSRLLSPFISEFNADISAETLIFKSSATTSAGNIAGSPLTRTPPATLNQTPTIQYPALQTLSESVVSARENSKGITVRLDPPELGRVYIDFIFETDRPVTVVIKAETQDANIQLRERAEPFLNLLREHGLDNVTLQFGMADKGASEHHNENSFSLPNDKDTREDSDHDFSATKSNHKTLSRSALDIKL